MADLALVYEMLKGARGLGERDLRVGPMHLVDVDVIDAEGLQALIDSTAKPIGAGVAHEPLLSHPQTALGRDHHLVPAIVEIVAEGFSQHPL